MLHCNQNNGNCSTQLKCPCSFHVYQNTAKLFMLKNLHFYRTSVLCLMEQTNREGVCLLLSLLMFGRIGRLKLLAVPVQHLIFQCLVLLSYGRKPSSLIKKFT